jgi:glycosyltransferase involved in cell wall biosynthesis
MNTQRPDIQVLSPDDDAAGQSTDISIVIPMYNESAMLAELFQRLENTLAEIGGEIEVILVDDGSSDSTWLDATHYSPRNFSTHCIALSRNFGKEAALTAGLNAVTGQAIIILDADCQDPPELIPEMLAQMEQGADVVNMKRRTREGESWLKRKSSTLYYRLLGTLSDVDIPANVGDFRLMSRRVVDEVNRLGERNRYMKGILAWPGFNQVTMLYDRQPRAAGASKWNYWQLSALAVSGITAFSNKPLRFASWVGTMVALSAFFYGLWVLIRTLIFGDPVTGYPSLMLVILFLGGIQLTTIGILGEYVGRIFTEVKNRPSYIIREARSQQGTSSSPHIHSV